MADKRITELQAIDAAGTQGSVDVLAIADVSAAETKKITAGDLVAAGLSGGVPDGSIPGEKIEVGSIPGNRLENNSVGPRELVPDAVQTIHIKAENVIGGNDRAISRIAYKTVTSGNIADGAIESRHLSNSINIDGDQISDGSITSDQIVNLHGSKLDDRSVPGVKLELNTVTAAEIATNAVGADELQADAVGTAHIQNLAVTNAKLASDSVTTDKLADQSVTDAKVAFGINGAKLQLNSVNTPQLAAGAVGTTELKDNAVTSDKIAANAVGTDELADLAVTEAKIATDAVTNTKLADSSVATENLQNKAVTSEKLADNSVSGLQLAPDSVSGVHISDNAVSNEHLASGIDGAKLANGSVANVKLASGIDGAKLTVRSVPGSALVGGSVTSAEIAGDAVGSSELADNSVDTGALQDDSITTPKYRNASVTNEKLADGIDGSKLLDASVPLDKLAGGTLPPEAFDEIPLTALPEAPSGTVLAGPITGSPADPNYRKLVGADLPAATADDKGAVSVPTTGGLAVNGAGAVSINNTVAAGGFPFINYNEHGLVIGGRALSNSDLPPPALGEIGGVKAGDGITIANDGTISQAKTGVTPDSYAKVTVDDMGNVTAGGELEASDIPNIEWDQINNPSIDSQALADKSVQMRHLADYSISFIQEIQPTITADVHVGTFWFRESTAALHQWNGNSWMSVGIGRLSAENLRYCGIFNADTNEITGLTQFGAAEGFVVGERIPDATDDRTGVYFVCEVAGSNVTVVPGVGFDEGDWCLCNGLAAGWVRIDTMVGGGGGGGGSGATRLEDLFDVAIPLATEGAFLQLASDGQWKDVYSIDAGVF